MYTSKIEGFARKHENRGGFQGPQGTKVLRQCYVVVERLRQLNFSRFDRISL
jgi:hypothetical protein